MNNRLVPIMILLTAGVILSALRYGRIGQLPPSKKIALAALRTIWIIGLILSFLEPTFRFERFEPGRVRIPVLIDASMSMRNFSPESSVLPFLDSLASARSRAGGRVDFEFFLFGDSTRKIEPEFPLSYHDGSISNDKSYETGRISFSDIKSSFPAVIDGGGKSFSNDMIIVTDGHWTRPRGSGEIFPRSNIYYLAMPESNPNPFVTVSYGAPETAPVDSPFTVSASVNGYARETGRMTVSLKEKNRVIRTESVEVEQGYFARTIDFKTSNPRPGRKLYTIEAAVNADIAGTGASSAENNTGNASFVHQTIPHFLNYSIYSAKPSLDRRYIAQALISDGFFKEKGTSPDILFIFDWDSTAARMMRGLPRHAAAVFIGALPCGTSTIAAPSISIRQPGNAAFNTGLDLRAMPPPAEIVTCKQPPISGVKRMLYAAVGGDIRGNTADQENVQILFSGRFRGTRSIFCPVRGIWRWDFWPMSSDRAESELFSFSNIILSIAREQLLDNIADQLILYPAGALHETDSAKFFMSLPAAVPVFEPVKLSVSVLGDGIKMDTTMDYLPAGLNRQPLSLPALPPGKYAISSTLTAPGVKAAFADSFTVNKDMSELSVVAQNTQYLRQFAQPLDMADWAGTASVLDSWAQASAERNTVTETIRIHRTWLLLGIILTLFAAELGLRRWWGVD